MVLQLDIYILRDILNEIGLSEYILMIKNTPEFITLKQSEGKK